MSEFKQESEHKPIGLPPGMRARLERFQRQVWVIKIAEGALAAVFGLVISYLAVFLLDRLFDTPPVVRIGLLILGSVGLFILFPLKLRRWVWRNRRMDQVARLLRYKYPRFGDHLLGIVELACNESRASASMALVMAAIRQVEAELEDRNLDDAVPHPRQVRWAWMTGLPLVLVVVLIWLAPGATGNAFLRWAFPWRPVDRYTFVQVEDVPEDRVVPYAEPFTVAIRLKEDSSWKPDTGEALLAGQAPVVASRSDGAFPFNMPPQTETGRMTIRIGDSRMSILVEPMLRPALSGLVAEVHLPEYLRRTEPFNEDIRGGALRLVRGSHAVIMGTATRDLAEAKLNGKLQIVDGPQLRTEALAIDETMELWLEWIDQFGLEAIEPQVLRVEAVDDQAPVASLKELKNKQVVLVEEGIAFSIEAGDDFGLKRVGIEWAGVKDPFLDFEPARGEKIVAVGGPLDSQLTVPATFSAEQEGVRPQIILLRAFAEDYLPGRQRTYSPNILLHLLSSAEHFEWLTQQMNQWVAAAREVYDMELLLNQMNEELMNMPPEDLDDPAQRKRIREQASAEKANAVKLEGLIGVGRQLVQEATRNDEFNPDQLDSWAEMLKQLEEVAGRGMPSVAALLDRAAAAPGQASASSGRQNKPGQQQASNGAANREQRDDGENQENKQQSDQDQNEPAAGPASQVESMPVPEDRESGMSGSDKPEQAQQSPPGLGIPSTTLQGSGPRESEEKAASAESAKELVSEAVGEQQALLDAMGMLAEEMRALLEGFENSTFVKRLKAASRKQIDMAQDLNSLDGFGLEKADAPDPERLETLGEIQTSASETVSVIQEDMAAYAERRPSEHFAQVLDEMWNAGVVEQMRGMSSLIQRNMVGRSTIDAEYWAGVLDRWAEQLVPDLAGEEEEPSEPSSEKPANLTPQMIVEILQIIRSEIQLREETREVEHVRDGLDEAVFKERAGALSNTQQALAEQSWNLVARIRDLPDSDKLSDDIAKLSQAAGVMDEVRELLDRPETGPATIAAISEVIEILVETRRSQDNNAKPEAKEDAVPALLLMGLGDDLGEAFIEERAPAQATGRTGSMLPEEFRQGLDQYFNALGGQPAGNP